MRKRHIRPERDLSLVFSYFLIFATFRVFFFPCYVSGFLNYSLIHLSLEKKSRYKGKKKSCFELPVKITCKKENWQVCFRTVAESNIVIVKKEIK